MKAETTCLAFEDELVRRSPPSAQLAAHLAVCPTCAETRRAIESTWGVGTTIPTDHIDRLTRGVLAANLPPVAASAAAGGGMPAAVTSAILGPTAVGALVGLVLGTVGWWSFQPVSIEPSVSPVAPQSISGSPVPRGSEGKVNPDSIKAVPPTRLDGATVSAEPWAAGGGHSTPSILLEQDSEGEP